MAGKTVIVTGGANGIGFACARRFAQDGFNVVIADRSEAAGEQAVQDLEGLAGQATFIQCDVSQKLEVHNLVAEAISQFNQIDVLINNAAVSYTHLTLPTKRIV